MTNSQDSEPKLLFLLLSLPLPSAFWEGDIRGSGKVLGWRMIPTDLPAEAWKIREAPGPSGSDNKARWSKLPGVPVPWDLGILSQIGPEVLTWIQ